MKPTPIATVLNRMRILPRHLKIAHLRGLIASEPKRSIRRRALQAALIPILNQQIKAEIRDDRKAS